jgi:protein polybromo-1
VIKRPIDLERISQKLKSSQYESLDDMVSDFVLMFDNACKYNEPDSQIYKVTVLAKLDILVMLKMNLMIISPCLFT